jgi:hypothetical protein
MNPPDTTLARDAGSVHPPMVSQFEPNKKLAVPKFGSAKEYAALNDDSLYSEYAWEFLRRNRFYQAMVDGTRPSFDLAQWGYRPTAAHEAGFGLQCVKHYSESHDDSPPQWTPIEAMVDRMKDTVAHFKHHKPRIEYPGAQVAVVFDLAPVFGPATVALQTQADFAVKYLERLLTTGNLLQTSRATGGEAAKESTNKPNRQLLRGYLRLADILSNPQTLLSEGTDHLPMAKRRGKPGMLTIEQAATLLPDYDVADDKRSTITDRQRRDRAYRYAENAWKLIYGWECLSILKFDQLELPSLKRVLSS